MSFLLGVITASVSFIFNDKAVRNLSKLSKTIMLFWMILSSVTDVLCGKIVYLDSARQG